MSKRIAGLIAGLGLVVVAVVLLRQQMAGPEEDTPVVEVAGAPAPTPASEPEAEARDEEAATPIERAPAEDIKEEPAVIAAVPASEEIAEFETVPDQLYTFRGDQVLATVNNVAVRGSDLSAFASNASLEERSMSAEMYAFRLDQAIERELTFQAAESEGVELTEADLGHLDRLQRSRRHDEAVVDSLGDQEAIIAFEVIQAQARLFENALLEHRGVAPPYVTEADVEEHYLAHGDAYEPLPEEPEARQAAWLSLSLAIRGELAPTLLRAYQDHRQEFIEELRANADIQILSDAGNTDVIQ